MTINSLHSVTALSRLGWSWWLEHRWLPLQNLVGMSTVNSHPALVSHHITAASKPLCLDLVHGPTHWTKLSFVWALPAWNKLTYCLPSWSHYTPMYIVFPGSKCTLSTTLHTVTVTAAAASHHNSHSSLRVVVKTRTYTVQLFCNDHFYQDYTEEKHLALSHMITMEGSYLSLFVVAVLAI